MDKINWHNGSDGLRRAQFRTPGFDCRRECQHEHKGDHGWHADEWNYVVSNGRAALSLEVFAAEFADDPGLTAEWNYRLCRGVKGSALNLHLSWATSEDAIRSGDKPGSCSYVEGGCYAGGSSYLGAAELFAAHGSVDGIEQPEAFWLALEERFMKWFVAADEKPRRHRCTHCNGDGLIPLPSVGS